MVRRTLVDQYPEHGSPPSRPRADTQPEQENPVHHTAQKKREKREGRKEGKKDGRKEEKDRKSVV